MLSACAAFAQGGGEQELARPRYALVEKASPEPRGGPIRLKGNELEKGSRGSATAQALSS